MIKSIRSNRSTFKKIVFHEGFNIILADRQFTDDKDEKKKTRNGSGKTTLVEIMHFCLGSSVKADSIFKSEYLVGWSFTLEMEVSGLTLEFERHVDNPNRVFVYGDVNKLDWDWKKDKESSENYVSLAKLSEGLLSLCFGLFKNETKYTPSFRDLISYMIRRNIDGYRDAFEFWKSQNAGSRQMCNTYFLDLNMNFASKFLSLKEELKAINDYRLAAKSTIMGILTLETGKLNTELITRKKDMEEIKQQLDSFRVHPQYYEITEAANSITDEIHQLSNTLVVRQQLLSRYEKSVEEEESDISSEDIEKIYAEAGVVFGGNVKVQLADVISFHRNLLANRKEYLQTEIGRLRREISGLKEKIELLTSERAESLRILETHGALEEHTAIQEKYSRCVQLYEDTKKRLEVANHVTNRKSEIKIETEELLLSARKDYDERLSSREKSVSIFKKNTEVLYQEPGILTIDLKDSGYVFGVDIKNAKSQGVNYMKVFCYDMLLAELGVDRKYFPDFLVHDSTVFDGVDERQIAKALMMAHKKSSTLGFQYICLMNSDLVPTSEFDDGFGKIFDESVIIRLNDSEEDGGVLGIRF